MKQRMRTTVEQRQFDALAVRPEGFRYPERFHWVLAEQPLPEIDPFMWVSEYEDQTHGWAEILSTQFPERTLVPFAKHGDTDDVFCFEGTDQSGNPPVLIIHTFTTPGWEYRGSWSTFDLWWEEMEEQHAAWLAEQESEED